MNTLTIQLSFVGVLLAFIYPFMKRFTHLPQLFLGFAYSWSIPMAWAAQTNELTVMAGYIFLINLLWTIAYDTQYAMVDRDDDLKIGIKSTAILFGRYDKFVIGVLQLSTLIMLIVLGRLYSLGLTYYAFLAAALSLFAFQQFIMRGRDRHQCFRAFLNNNYVGMLITLGLLISFSREGACSPYLNVRWSFQWLDRYFLVLLSEPRDKVDCRVVQQVVDFYLYCTSFGINVSLLFSVVKCRKCTFIKKLRCINAMQPTNLCAIS